MLVLFSIPFLIAGGIFKYTALPFCLLGDGLIRAGGRFKMITWPFLIVGHVLRCLALPFCLLGDGLIRPGLWLMRFTVRTVRKVAQPA